MWTGGQEDVFIFYASFFLVPYKMFYKSVDLWTRSCFLFHVFFLSCTLQNVLQKCGLVDKKLFFYFMFSFPLVPFIFWQKVWTGGQALKILKILMTTFFLVPFKIFAKSVDRWTRSCFYISFFLPFLYPTKCFTKDVFLFHVFFLSFTLYIFIYIEFKMSVLSKLGGHWNVFSLLEVIV